MVHALGAMANTSLEYPTRQAAWLLLSLVVLRRYVRRTSTKYGGNRRFKDGDHGAANVMRPIAGSIWRIDCSKPHDEDEQQQYWHDSSKSLGRRVALSVDQF